LKIDSSDRLFDEGYVFLTDFLAKGTRF